MPAPQRMSPGRPAAVEGQEARALAGQPRRHVDLVGVGGEVDQGALAELEDGGGGVAVLLVLPHGAAPSLTGHRVLEFAGGYRQAVEREDQVHGLTAAGMAGHLAGDHELVARELCEGLRVQAVGRLEPRQPERLAVELEPVAQHVERALEVELPDQRVDDQPLQVVAVQPDHRVPRLGLRRPHESHGARREQRPRNVPLRPVARAPAAHVEHRLNGRFECLFVCLAAHGRLCSRDRLGRRFAHVDLAGHGGGDEGSPVLL